MQARTVEVVVGSSGRARCVENERGRLGWCWWGLFFTAGVYRLIGSFLHPADSGTDDYDDA
jgi:hypothetical protein